MFDIADEEIATIAELLAGTVEDDARARAASTEKRRKESRKRLASAGRRLAALSPEERAEVEAEALALLSPVDRAGLEERAERSWGIYRKLAGRLARRRLAAQVTA